MTSLLQASVFSLWISLSGFSQTTLIEGDHYANEFVGFSLTKPRDWHFASLEEFISDQVVPETAQEKRELSESNAYLRSLGQRTGMVPLFVQRYPVPTKKVNPSFQVALTPFNAKLSAVSILQMQLQVAEQNNPKVRRIQPAEPITISGLPAARAQWSDQVKTEDGEWVKILTDYFIVPRGDAFFQISFSRKSEESLKIEQEAQEMWRSIKIDPIR